MHPHRSHLHRRNIAFLPLSFLFIVTGVSVCISQEDKSNVVKYASPQNDKIAPKTDLCRALRKLYPADTKAHIEANIQAIEAALAQYGTKDPWASKAFYELGHTRYLLGRYEEALPDLESCLRLPEPHVGVHFGAQNERIQILRRLGRPIEAIAATKDFAKTPAPPLLREKFMSNNLMVRADIQARLKNQKKAAADTYKEFLKLAKKKKSKYWKAWTPYAYRALADQLIRTGKIKEAVSTYDEFLKKYPKDPASSLIAMKRLRLVSCGKEECVLTLKDLMQLVKSYPTNSGAGQHVLYELGMAYVTEDKLDSAAQVLKNMMNFKPEPDDREYSITLAARASLDLSQVLESLGKEDERAKVLEEIVRRFPDLPEAKIAREYLKQMRAERFRRSIYTAIKVGIPLAIIGVAILFTNRRRVNSR